MKIYRVGSNYYDYKPRFGEDVEEIEVKEEVDANRLIIDVRVLENGDYNISSSSTGLTNLQIIGVCNIVISEVIANTKKNAY